MLLSAARVLALSTNRPVEKPPALRPPLELLPPSAWEQHSAVIAAAVCVLLVGIALLVWWLTRPKPVASVAPELLARRALEALRGQSEDPPLFSEVSRQLRRYLQAVLRLPPQEWTPDELLPVLRAEAHVDSTLIEDLRQLLRECEVRAFAPAPPAAQPALVERALDLAVRVEKAAAPALAPPLGSSGDEPARTAVPPASP